MDALNTSHLRRWKLETTYQRARESDDKQTSGIDGWRRVNCLGQGGFGQVWLEHCVSGPLKDSTRAVKALPKLERNHILKRELDALTRFSDPNTNKYKQHFVQFLGWFDNVENFYIAMEYLQLGSLERFIKTPLPEPEAAFIVVQVAQALQYMHSENFIHRDIKPENILVCHEGPNWHVKVADFGLAKCTEGSTPGTAIGTEGYLAPEQARNDLDPHTAAVDVWALWAVAFRLRAGKTAFPTVAELVDYTREPRLFPIRLLDNSSYSCKRFVRATMANLPEQRLTIKDVLAHPWLIRPGDSESAQRKDDVPEPISAFHQEDEESKQLGDADLKSTTLCREFESSPLQNESPEIPQADTQDSSENPATMPHQGGVRPILGLSLDDLSKRDGVAVPSLLTQCFLAVENFGLFFKKIYHQNSKGIHVDQIISSLEAGAPEVDLASPENFYHDVDSVAALVRRFFKQLPDPLLSSQYYSEFIDAARTKDDIQRRDWLHALVQCLPETNYAVARALFLHLNKVQEHSAQNDMTIFKLAISFGPTLLHGYSDSDKKKPIDATLQIRVVRTILENVLQIFGED
ncbi:hypothetical protein N7540_000217 [Penicillium herquei]|nr:hypothetical protein N7540_000217 [Penicillium herquei]